MTVNPERAREIANDYLSRISPGTEAREVEEFYGYYTLHTEEDGEITGMLSVNGYSGEVWYPHRATGGEDGGDDRRTGNGEPCREPANATTPQRGNGCALEEIMCCLPGA